MTLLSITVAPTGSADQREAARRCGLVDGSRRKTSSSSESRSLGFRSPPTGACPPARARPGRPPILEPAGDERGLGRRAREPVGKLGPGAGQRAAPGQRAPPGDVRDRHTVELPTARRTRMGRPATRRSRRRGGRPCPPAVRTPSRSRGGRASGGRPAGRAGAAGRRCSPVPRLWRRGAATRPPRCRGAARSRRARSTRDARAASESSLSACGKRGASATGGAPSPASVSAAASCHSGGTQARWVRTLVRRSGPPPCECRYRRSTRAASISAIVAQSSTHSSTCATDATRRAPAARGPQVPAG